MSTYTHAKNLQPRAGLFYEKTNVINVSRQGRIVSAATGMAILSGSGYIKQPFIKRMLKAAGLYLLYRGVSGNCPITSTLGKKVEPEMHAPAINIKSSCLVNQSKEVVYDFWKDFENLPIFMRHLQRVTILNDKQSHWVIKTPGNMPSVEWDAEILEDNGSELSWRSLPGSMIETAGKLKFEGWPGDKTQIDILISYRPPAGYIGTAVATLLKTPFENIIKEDVENFKQYIEAGKVFF